MTISESESAQGKGQKAEAIALANQDELENSEITKKKKRKKKNELIEARIWAQERYLTDSTSFVMEFSHSDIAGTSDKEKFRHSSHHILFRILFEVF